MLCVDVELILVQIKLEERERVLGKCFGGTAVIYQSSAQDLQTTNLFPVPCSLTKAATAATKQLLVPATTALISRSAVRCTVRAVGRAFRIYLNP
jgi:hypothetical protein